MIEQTEQIDEKCHGFMQPKWKILAAGAFAGLIVDSSLYPIDTLKSRLQSEKGFRKAGGFGNVYSGLTPIIVCSVPNGKLA